MSKVLGPWWKWGKNIRALEAAWHSKSLDHLMTAFEQCTPAEFNRICRTSPILKHWLIQESNTFTLAITQMTQPTQEASLLVKNIATALSRQPRLLKQIVQHPLNYMIDKNAFTILQNAYRAVAGTNDVFARIANQLFKQASRGWRWPWVVFREWRFQKLWGRPHPDAIAREQYKTIFAPWHRGESRSQQAQQEELVPLLPQGSGEPYIPGTPKTPVHPRVLELRGGRTPAGTPQSPPPSETPYTPYSAGGCRVDDYAEEDPEESSELGSLPSDFSPQYSVAQALIGSKSAGSPLKSSHSQSNTPAEQKEASSVLDSLATPAKN